jgi:hypothetical protein
MLPKGVLMVTLLLLNGSLLETLDVNNTLLLGVDNLNLAFAAASFGLYTALFTRPAFFRVLGSIKVGINFSSTALTVLARELALNGIP